jgi:hypothetical protein
MTWRALAWAVLGWLGAGGWGCGGSSQPPDPCQEVVCNTPPGPRCEERTRISYGPGVCVAGGCRYDPFTQVCPQACLNGQCVETLCRPEDCRTPPPSACANVDELLVYPDQGVCDPGGQACAYVPERVACPFGCAQAACQACREDADCGAAPPTCLSAELSRVYLPRCAQGRCQQEPSTVDCVAQGLVCEDGVCTGSPIPRPGPGDLVVTEFMANPAAVADSRGEWFEIANVTAGSLELAGLRVGDAQGVAFSVSPGASRVLEAGARFVLGIHDDPLVNGGVAVDWRYGSFNLANTADCIELGAPDGTLVDRVCYDAAQGWPLRAGASTLLQAHALSAGANDAPGSWCPAADAYGEGDQGTPGQPGGACAFCQRDEDCPTPPPACLDATRLEEYLTACEDGSCAQISVETDCARQGLQCRGGACVSSFPAPGAGELVVTEFMADPAAVGDAVGEWIEIANPSARTLELSGVVLRDDGSQRFTLSPDRSLVLPAGGLLTLAASGDSALNGGFKPDVVWSGFGLTNTADAIVLVNPAGAEIDAVRYSASGGWPIRAGRSAQLDPAHLASTANDDPGRWCLSNTIYGAGDQGTPGSSNQPCGGR